MPNRFTFHASISTISSTDSLYDSEEIARKVRGKAFQQRFNSRSGRTETCRDKATRKSKAAGGAQRGTRERSTTPSARKASRATPPVTPTPSRTQERARLSTPRTGRPGPFAKDAFQQDVPMAEQASPPRPLSPFKRGLNFIVESFVPYFAPFDGYRNGCNNGHSTLTPSGSFSNAPGAYPSSFDPPSSSNPYPSPTSHSSMDDLESADDSSAVHTPRNSSSFNIPEPEDVSMCDQSLDESPEVEAERNSTPKAAQHDCPEPAFAPGVFTQESPSQAPTGKDRHRKSKRQERANSSRKSKRKGKTTKSRKSGRQEKEDSPRKREGVRAAAGEKSTQPDNSQSPKGKSQATREVPVSESEETRERRARTAKILRDLDIELARRKILREQGRERDRKRNEARRAAEAAKEEEEARERERKRKHDLFMEELRRFAEGKHRHRADGHPAPSDSGSCGPERTSRRQSAKYNPYPAAGASGSQSKDASHLDGGNFFSQGPTPQPYFPPRAPAPVPEPQVDPLKALFVRYERLWARLSSPLTETTALGFASVPWPMLTAPSAPGDITAEGISAFLFHEDRTTAARKRVVKEELLRWHPDKFAVRVLGRVVDPVEHEHVSAGADIVSKVLTGLM
ncbi:hypothetical protein M0805_004557 [Coniferiporia weirii]|nr:hypothetical protein M0805_004557 [Coniferiporia weirii]